MRHTSSRSVNQPMTISVRGLPGSGFERFLAELSDRSFPIPSETAPPCRGASRICILGSRARDEVREVRAVTRPWGTFGRSSQSRYLRGRVNGFVLPAEGCRRRVFSRKSHPIGAAVVSHTSTATVAAAPSASCTTGEGDGVRRRVLVHSSRKYADHTSAFAMVAS